MAAVATAEAIEKTSGLHPMIKWPNDLHMLATEAHERSSSLAERLATHGPSCRIFPFALIRGMLLIYNYNV
jgi:hypothetical protein